MDSHTSIQQLKLRLYQIQFAIRFIFCKQLYPLNKLILMLNTHGLATQAL